MAAIVSYPRGFVIFRKADKPMLPTNWSRIDLGTSAWAFAYENSEVPQIIKIRNTNQWVLVHGLCLYAGSDRRDLSPTERLAEAAEAGDSAFLDLLDELGGRHVILRGNSEEFVVYQDATGMRSVYYSSQGVLVGSHVHLLNDLKSHEQRTESQGLNDFIQSWDRTPFIGIDALLPNHSLKIPEFTVTRFYPRAINRYAQWTKGERIKEYRSLWERQWMSLEAERHEHELVMSLTGGHDSRTTLALLADRLPRIQTFTYTVPHVTNNAWARSLRLDGDIVEQIKHCVELNHKYIVKTVTGPTMSQSTLSVLKKNTVYNHGSWLLPYYLAEFAEGDVIHIRGNSYGVYKAPWKATRDNNNLKSLRLLYGRLKGPRQSEETKESQDRHLDRSITKWAYDQEVFDFHLYELMFWEVRMGRWASEIYNETDIAFQSFEPSAVRKMIEIALSFSISDKSNQLLQSELINASYPLLNFPGKNDSRNLYEQYRDHRQKTLTGSTSANALRLSPSLDIKGQDGIIESYVMHYEELYIPKDHFSCGVTATRSLELLKEPGIITFEIDTKYYNPAAKNYWQYRISVNGTPKLVWDGASQGRTIHIAVGNVDPGTLITVEATALRNQVGMNSWETASRANIQFARFTPRAKDGEPWVSGDVK